MGVNIEIPDGELFRGQAATLLVEMARKKVLDTSRIVTRTVPLDADAVNAALDELENFSGDVRTVIVPASN